MLEELIPLFVTVMASILTAVLFYIAKILKEMVKNVEIHNVLLLGDADLNTIGLIKRVEELEAGNNVIQRILVELIYRLKTAGLLKCDEEFSELFRSLKKR